MTPEEITAKIEEKAKQLFDAGKADTLAEAKKLAQGIVAESAETIKSVKSELQAEIKVVKDELDKTKNANEELITKMNRIKEASLENAKKGRSFDEALGEALEENQEQIKTMARGRTKSVMMELKAVGDMGTGSISNLDAANVQMASGIYNLPNRRIHMRDIMVGGRMTTSDFHYLRETGGEGDVAPWLEVQTGQTTAKSQLDLDYEEAVAPSQYVAGFLKISRKSLDDIIALRASLSQRLLEKYLNAEDTQILSGGGTPPALQGILGVASDLDPSDEERSIDRIITSIAQIEEADYRANGVILKPKEYYALLKTFEAGGGYTLPGIGTVMFVNGVLMVAGVPVYPINGMPSSPRQFLTGDWQMGAQLLIREDPRVEFFDQDGTNVQTNQITVRVEGRIALPIYYPESFVVGDFYATT